MPIHITEEGKIVYYAYPNGDRFLIFHIADISDRNIPFLI
mgnify:CR=1 FL=1